MLPVGQGFPLQDTETDVKEVLRREENTPYNNWSDGRRRVPGIRDTSPGDTNEEQGAA
jgi:hypothetical protein